MTKYIIQVGTTVVENEDYEVVIGGEFSLLDFVPCRAKYSTVSAKCVFLAASVLGISIEEGTIDESSI